MPTASAAIDIPGTSDVAGYRIEARILEPTESTMAGIKGDKSPFLEYLDLDRIGRPLIVRARRAGDQFVPLGQRGRKKVGKFLTTAKVPEKSRQQVLVFDDGEKLVWVCPVRIDDRAKVTEKTQRILMLNVTRQPPS